MIDTKKTTQDVLQDEMLRERVATLARAGEQLAAALEKLHKMEGEIAAGMAVCRAGERAGTAVGHVGEAPGGPATRGMGAGEGSGGQRFLYELNRKIQSYNRQRENVRTRYYYLIVTREALGMIHHQRIEEFYRIPPKKHCLPEG
jgi:hypothetical protein